ncbi:AI-2E family transporter [Methanosarcina sp. DH2]|uniref:AI-2E family transporter n=1 Tax=Methanosarcina sp. DH2 TaxID=2605639 RepID=UPI001E283A3B|nr:AI-2E family transporter [Methanosarcina sp. DH2]MCC4770711.1 AI-2E family transporter [Methanosarcina sp. DH2]
MKNYDPVKAIYIAIFILVSLYALYITSAFFCVLVLSALFAYVIHPVYFFCLRFIKSKQICALIPLGTILLITVSSGVMIVKALMNEISKLLEIPNTINGFASMDLRRIVGVFEPFIQTHPGKLTASIGAYLNSLVTDYVPEIQNNIFQISTDLSILIIELVVIIVLTYYLLVESETIATELPNLFPDRKLGVVFLGELNYIYQSLFIVYFLTCLVTGVIGGVLYWVLGIPYPLIWGVITFIMALLPVVGAGTVYGLLALYYILIQDFFTAGALFFLGIILLNLVPDFVIRPKLARSRGAIHPAITLIAFAAPVFVLGPIGVIIGPLTYGFLLAVFRTKKILGTPPVQTDNSTASPIEGPVENTVERSFQLSVEKSVERSVEASGDHIFSPEINPWHDRKKAI